MLDAHHPHQFILHRKARKGHALGHFRLEFAKRHIGVMPAIRRNCTAIGLSRQVDDSQDCGHIACVAWPDRTGLSIIVCLVHKPPSFDPAIMQKAGGPS
jgi:hypothetical protein